MSMAFSIGFIDINNFSFIQIKFNADKRDNLKYGEKFPHTPFSPSLSHYGGRPLDGFIGVTSTGLVLYHFQ